jgi:hypothetical protein
VNLACRFGAITGWQRPEDLIPSRNRFVKKAQVTSVDVDESQRPTIGTIVIFSVP